MVSLKYVVFFKIGNKDFIIQVDNCFTIINSEMHTFMVNPMTYLGNRNLENHR